jgi:hypothetical protein
MRRSQDTVQTSLAWTRALRAAALLLNREVCRYVMACRSDMPSAQRAHLEHLSHRAWDEACALYSSEVWQHFEIDEAELRRRALNLARLRMAGRIAEAAEAEREALRRALSAA